MADFRKLFVLLAVLVLATGAYAQVGNYGCTVSTAVNNQVRGGGLTELAGDVTLQCQGQTPGTPDPTVTNFLASMQPAIPVTNRIGTFNPAFGGWPISARLQVWDSTNTLLLQSVTGYLVPLTPGSTSTAGANTVLFPGVILPQGTLRNVRITNIRVVAPTVSTIGSATQIFEYISNSQPSLVPVANPLPLVATVFPPLQFSVTNCAGGAAPSLSFQQCIAEPRGGANSLSFGIKFTEALLTAFKPALAISPNTNQESGSIDTADTGTRLLVTFTGIPAGVTIKVTDRNIFPGTSTGSTAGTLAAFVSNAAADGSGGTVNTLDAGVNLSCTVGSSTTIPVANLVNALSSGGNIYAVWEIQTENQNQVDVALFGVQISYTPNTTQNLPAITTTPGSITGNLAPVSTVAQATGSASSGPIPRFLALNLGGGSNPFSISPCVTNLLFPYLTTTAGYDTGIALSNTSLDNLTGSTGTPPNMPFNTPTQAGTCTVYLFGTAGGQTAAIAPLVTPTIAAGKIFKFSLGSASTAPGVSNWPNVTGFDGYGIVRCNFQFGHGFAFITDTHVPGFGSEGYLALIIPDTGYTSRYPDPFTAYGTGKGEQLAF